MRYIYFFYFIMLAHSPYMLAQNNPAPALTETDFFVRDFKMNFLVNCLLKSYANPCFNEEMITESSFCKDFCLGEDNYYLLDSLAEKVVWQINRDSIQNAQYIITRNSTPEEIENSRNEGMLGKSTLHTCLQYYLSDELDKIAKDRVNK